MNDPKVYVGTYKKYNNGSIAGGWVSLNECEDYRAFLKKCRALHRGERDPEYMIQDSEDFPDGLDCMEWLTEQDFNDVKAAVAEQNHEPKLNAAMLRSALLAMMGGKTAEKAETKYDAGMYKTWLEEYIALDLGWADYYRKNNVGALKIHDAYYLIEKPHMENRFCFHDEGPDYDFYCNLMKDKETRLAEYFRQENLSKFDKLIDYLENGGKYSQDKRLWWSVNDRRFHIYTSDCWSSWELEKHELCTDEEKAKILAALKYGREQMAKRVDSYLKRYGVSKIHTWTYWADA